MDKKPIIILAVILGVVILLVLVLGGSAIGSYNTLVTKQQEVNAKWSQVENQMQRRADLIPNIVATVKGIAVASTRAERQSIRNSETTMTIRTASTKQCTK